MTTTRRRRAPTSHMLCPLHPSDIPPSTRSSTSRQRRPSRHPSFIRTRPWKITPFRRPPTTSTTTSLSKVHRHHCNSTSQGYSDHWSSTMPLRLVCAGIGLFHWPRGRWAWRTPTRGLDWSASFWVMALTQCHLQEEETPFSCLPIIPDGSTDFKRHVTWKAREKIQCPSGWRTKHRTYDDKRSTTDGDKGSATDDDKRPTKDDDKKLTTDDDKDDNNRWRRCYSALWTRRFFSFISELDISVDVNRGS